MENKIRGLKNVIEGAIISAQELSSEIGRGDGGREVSICTTKLEEALHRMIDLENKQHQLEMEESAFLGA